MPSPTRAHTPGMPWSETIFAAPFGSAASNVGAKNGAARVCPGLHAESNGTGIRVQASPRDLRPGTSLLAVWAERRWSRSVCGLQPGQTPESSWRARLRGPAIGRSASSGRPRGNQSSRSTELHSIQALNAARKWPVIPQDPLCLASVACAGEFCSAPSPVR